MSGEPVYPYGQVPSAGAPAPREPWHPSNGGKFDGQIGDGEHSGDEEPEQQFASAPPLETLLPGYEHLSSFNMEANVPPPPSYDMHKEFAEIDSARQRYLSDEEARDALLEYVSQHCCYGKGAAEKMEIKGITGASALHYTLETFTEGRSTKWKTVPHSGGWVDGPYNGPAPSPWEIPCNFDQLFRDQVIDIEVPHTATVRTCHNCCGRGFVRCWKCRGRGTIRCRTCHGSGRGDCEDNPRCGECHGNGRRRCHPCYGSGCVQCRQCSGYGQLKQFVELTVNYRNRKGDHIIERTDLPDHLIGDVTGDVIFNQQAAWVAPISNHMEPEINRRSAEIVAQHATAWPSERVHQQRQMLQSVPVFEIAFKFNDREGRFWVYGDQRAVFTEDYPHTCCCCVIL